MFWRNNKVFYFLPAALIVVVAVVGRGAAAFVVSPHAKHTTGRPSAAAHYASPMLYSSTSPLNENDKDLLEESLKASAEQMKTMTPQQMEEMITEMDNMPAAARQQLEAMGMDVEVMKNTMRAMKDNPEMRESMGKMMENMTPEQLLEQSKLAQEQLKGFNQASMSTLQQQETDDVAEVDTEETNDDEEDEEEEKDEEEEEEDEPIQVDPQVLDAMFRVAELMSEPPEQGGATFQGFATVPPIAVLLAGSDEDDLSDKELKECWGKGSLGATRVDRAGFERVWMEVQDKYYNDIVEEARERTLVKKKRGSDKQTTTTTSTKPVVGANISPEQLSNQVKNMSEDDMSTMFERMNDMTPADEERMKAMGVDPAMMKKSAELMKNNPLLRKAASTMMKNSSPDQLMKASQQAQERMANMSEEEKKRLLDNLK